jgi:hypothetical protein
MSHDTSEAGRVIAGREYERVVWVRLNRDQPRCPTGAGERWRVLGFGASLCTLTSQVVAVCVNGPSAGRLTVGSPAAFVRSFRLLPEETL